MCDGVEAELSMRDRRTELTPRVINCQLAEYHHDLTLAGSNYHVYD